MDNCRHTINGNNHKIWATQLNRQVHDSQEAPPSVSSSAAELGGCRFFVSRRLVRQCGERLRKTSRTAPNTTTDLTFNGSALALSIPGRRQRELVACTSTTHPIRQMECHLWQGIISDILWLLDWGGKPETPTMMMVRRWYEHYSKEFSVTVGKANCFRMEMEQCRRQIMGSRVRATAQVRVVIICVYVCG